MSIAIAIVPLAGGARLSRSGLAKHFSTWDDVVAEPEVAKKQNTMSFEVGNYFVAIGLMPAPIPAEELEGPIATSWLWPDAATEMAQHKGHLIVTANTPDDADPIEIRKLLTKATASILASTDGALGVYWGDAGQLIGRELFVEMATELLPDALPFLLWIDFRVGAVDQDSGLSFGFTDGMEELGLMELVTENATEPPGELRERLMSLADYLLTNGPVIQDGHTVGQDAHEQITVVYGPSPFGHEGDVMKLDYSSRKKKKGWFR
ncbi:DUF4261 domain-containing protein [Aeoliella sp.]|uniref:DUF4261 domain-containing protein n=1 Tax=Aeoliella sp. TaxID=2795800 RepID=UPI003CCC29C1